MKSIAMPQLLRMLVVAAAVSLPVASSFCNHAVYQNAFLGRNPSTTNTQKQQSSSVASFRNSQQNRSDKFHFTTRWATPKGGIGEELPLIDLQTFLKLTNQVQSGGEAKAVIQGGDCVLNGEVETRRGKKLFTGDEVLYAGQHFDVLDEVNKKGYVWKVKKKKVKPVAKIDADGNLEFGGRHRSEEWRQERKAKKAEKKVIHRNKK